MMIPKVAPPNCDFFPRHDFRVGTFAIHIKIPAEGMECMGYFYVITSVVFPLDRKSFARVGNGVWILIVRAVEPCKGCMEVGNFQAAIISTPRFLQRFTKELRRIST